MVDRNDRLVVSEDLVKITLIHGKYSNSWEALGLGYIGAYLKKTLPNIEVDFFQGCFDSEDQILAAATTSDLVAFSCTTPTFDYCSNLAKKIKAKRSDVKTVFGGYHTSALGKASLNEYVDYAVVGEGEEAMRQIVCGMPTGIVAGPLMQFADLPWPDRKLIRNDRNIEVAYSDNKLRITSFQSHRGCPFLCKYCADGHNKVLYPGNKNPIRYRDPEDLLNEIEQVTTDYSLDLIKFCDPTWNTSVDWVKQFCHMKIKRNNKIPFYPNIHAGVCDQEMMDLMRRAGCSQIAVGIESGSPKILKDIGKGTTRESIMKGAMMAKKAGIPMRGYFILGMPNETEKDLLLTEEFADELPIDEYGFTILCPYPGTAMYDPVRFAHVDWARADEYSNDFWETEHLTNSQIKLWQKRLVEKFRNRLTQRSRI